MLVASASLAADATFESIHKEFQHKAISLLSDTNTSVADLQTRIAKFASETFGAHPDIMREEAERRFKTLPQFTNTHLTGYVEYKTSDEFPLPPPETGWVWLMFGWDPEKLADSAKKTILSRQVGVEGYGRLALLNACCPDKIYRLGDGKFPDLVVDSLGDLFVLKIQMTDVGVCKPVSVRWMKKKESRTTP
jgi:hypothetical protein